MTTVNLPSLGILLKSSKNGCIACRAATTFGSNLGALEFNPLGPLGLNLLGPSGVSSLSDTNTQLLLGLFVLFMLLIVEKIL